MFYERFIPSLKAFQTFHNSYGGIRYFIKSQEFFNKICYHFKNRVQHKKSGSGKNVGNAQSVSEFA